MGGPPVEPTQPWWEGTPSGAYGGYPPAYPPPPPPRRPRRHRRFFFLAIAAVVVAAVIGAELGSSRPSKTSGTTAVADAYGKASPGIVDVNTVLGYQGEAAAGTGIVLSPGGLILTNNHVIEGATKVHATDLDNGKTYSATVLGYDMAADVAVLRLAGATGLRTAPLSSSTHLNVGDAVTAAGNAGGRGGAPSILNGVIVALDQAISATDEAGGATEQLSGLIETNAALQPGDSGGPLLDHTGKVIGMDTAASSGFTFQGQTSGGEGFSIPIATADRLAREIEQSRSSAQVHVGPTPFLGVDVTTQSTGQNGASVLTVIPNTPADTAGLAPSDVIVSVDGQAVNTPTDLTRLLQRRSPGDTVHIDWVDPFGVKHGADIRLGTGPAQ